MSFFSNLIVPLVLCAVFLGALVQRVDLLSAFARGVREGLQVVLDMFPSLMLLTLAVSVFQSSGALELLSRALSAPASLLGLPEPIIPLTLLRPLNALFSIGEEAVVETAISGQEVTCGVLGEEALAPILIVSKGSYFDYHNKYAADGAQEICPAPLSPELTSKVQEHALRAHRALGLKGYSRADFILRDDGELFILEVNTTPGMTATSLVPREAAVRGMSFGALIERLLELALEK